MIKHVKRLSGNRGDTIVEVLFAMAIISALLAGGYTVSRSSLVAELQAQEQGEALQLVQGQIENLKNYAGTNQLTTPSPFCMYDNTTSNTQCTVSSSGSVTTRQPAYTLSIQPSGSADTYAVKAVWDDVSGSGQDNLTMYYKLYTQ